MNCPAPTGSHDFARWIRAILNAYGFAWVLASGHCELWNNAMRLVWYISIGMTLAGVALIIAGQVLDLDEFVTLAGMLTLVAGIAKVVIAGIWSSMFSEPVADDRP